VAKIIHKIIVRQRDMDGSRSKDPGLLKHDGILNRGLELQYVSIASPALNDVFFVAMNGRVHMPATHVSAQPRLIIESYRVDDQRISFPVADRVSHIRRFMVRCMWTSIRVYQAIRVVAFDHRYGLRSPGALTF